MKKYFLFISLACFLILSGGSCSDATNLGSSTVQTPEEWFKHVIADPVPVSVRNIEGRGEVWQGHNLYLKFDASQNFIFNELLKIHDYKEVGCSDASIGNMTLSNEDSKSLLFWNIEKIRTLPTAKCYVANGYKNKWTSEGYSQIMVNDVLMEPTTAETYWTVYFHEIGI